MLDLQVIILAAGKGTRMGADKPKVLVDMNDKPLIVHLLTELKKINLTYSPIIVVGHQAEKVQKTLGDKYKYVLQSNQHGTAHATAQTREVTQQRDPQAMLILYGDMPLIKSETIENIYNTHCDNQEKITMATADVDDFSGWKEGFYSFGRIVRNESGEITRTVEKQDASDPELSITEVNPSYFCFELEWLWNNISKIEDNNSQGEFYLTDIVEIAKKSDINIGSVDINPIEALGANTPKELKRMEELQNTQ